MHQINEIPSSFTQIHELLADFMPPVRSNRGAYTLERMRALMEYLGSPQNKYKTVHVAGTSGKTSTCYYIASLMRKSGQAVGLMVSPHVDEINERVQINLKPLTEKKFCSEFAIFIRLVNKTDIRPTYFELLSAFAFWEFARQKVTYAVIEVGLGGLLDATNVITRRDKICVITDIGLDHIEILGKTEALIASQKAGIIQPHNTVVMYEQASEVMDVVREVTGQQHAELHEVWPLKSGELPRNLPLFQRRNWYLALSVYQLLYGRDEIAPLDESQLAGSTEVYIPARMETVRFGDSTIIMDGAHNQQKLQSLVRSIKTKYPHTKFSIIVSFVQTKQARINHCLEALLPICDRLIVTTFSTIQAEKKSVDPLKIIDHCESLGFENWEVIADPTQAVRQTVRKNEYVLVTGSFYLLNHIRPILR